MKIDASLKVKYDRGHGIAILSFELVDAETQQKVLKDLGEFGLKDGDCLLLNHLTQLEKED